MTIPSATRSFRFNRAAPATSGSYVLAGPVDTAAANVIAMSIPDPVEVAVPPPLAAPPAGSLVAAPVSGRWEMYRILGNQSLVPVRH